MQGNDNFVRIYKQNEGENKGRDRKRDKERPKDQRKKLRKLKMREMEE